MNTNKQRFQPWIPSGANGFCPSTVSVSHGVGNSLGRCELPAVESSSMVPAFLLGSSSKLGVSKYGMTDSIYSNTLPSIILELQQASSSSSFFNWGVQFFFPVWFQDYGPKSNLFALVNPFGFPIHLQKKTAAKKNGLCTRGPSLARLVPNLGTGVQCGTFPLGQKGVSMAWLCTFGPPGRRLKRPGRSGRRAVWSPACGPSVPKHPTRSTTGICLGMFLSGDAKTRGVLWFPFTSKNG